jgi:hypothetical protein
MSCRVFERREKKSQRLKRNEDFKRGDVRTRAFRVHACAPARMFDALCRRALEAKRARASNTRAFQSQVGEKNSYLSNVTQEHETSLSLFLLSALCRAQRREKEKRSTIYALRKREKECARALKRKGRQSVPLRRQSQTCLE